MAHNDTFLTLPYNFPGNAFDTVLPYRDSKRRCDGCGSAVNTGGEHVSFGGYHYHRDCFKCKKWVRKFHRAWYACSQSTRRIYNVYKLFARFGWNDVCPYSQTILGMRGVVTYGRGESKVNGATLIGVWGSIVHWVESSIFSIMLSGNKVLRAG